MGGAEDFSAGRLGALCLSLHADMNVCVRSLSPFLFILTSKCRDGSLGGNPKLDILHYTNLNRLVLCVNTHLANIHTLHMRPI